MLWIVDANILIDLDHGNLLTAFFRLPFVIGAPVTVLDELHRPNISVLLQMGLVRIDLTPGQLLDVMMLRSEDSRLSLGDSSAFITARDTGALLLTGDQHLRIRAEEAGLEVHGILWVLDQFEVAEIVPANVLHQGLTRIREHNVRLPIDECEKRLKRWR